MALSLRIATQLKATATSDASLAMVFFFFSRTREEKGIKGSIFFLSCSCQVLPMIRRAFTADRRSESHSP